MLAYTLGPLLFGWYGLFLMPVLLVLVVQFARIVLPDLLADEPSTPMELVGVPLRPSQPVEPAEDGSLPRSEQSTE
jgi:hypothetical protein